MNGLKKRFFALVKFATFIYSVMGRRWLIAKIIDSFKIDIDKAKA